MSKLKQSHHKTNNKKFMKLWTSQRANLEFLPLNTSATHGGSLRKDSGTPVRMKSQQISTRMV
jgi:hypothetical protein